MSILDATAATTPYSDCPAPFSVLEDANEYWSQSIRAFYSIAGGIIDGVQATPPASTLEELYKFYHGGNIATIDVINDTSNQLGSQILLGIGAFVVFLSIILAIAVVARRCCCVKCCGHTKISAPPHPFTIYLNLFFSVVCFAFILTGTILYGISINNFIDSFYISIGSNSNTVGGATSAIERSVAQTYCAYNNIIDIPFQNMEHRLTTEPTTLTADWLNTTGILALSQYPEEALKNLTNRDTVMAQQLLIVLNNLKTVSPLSGNLYQTEISQTIDIVENSLPSLNRLSKNIDDVMTQTIITLRNTQPQQVNLFNMLTIQMSLLSNNMNATSAQIWSVVRNMTSTGSVSLTSSREIVLRNMLLVSNALTWNQFGLITSLSNLCVDFPASFALLFIVSCILGCGFRLYKNTEPTHRGFVSNLAGYYFVFGGYSLIFTTWLVMLAASAFVWYSYPMAVACYNMYDYNQLKHFYSTVDGPSIQQKQFNDSVTTMDYGTFLLSCQREPTLYNVWGYNIITASDIIKSTNVLGVEYDTIEVINSSYPLDVHFDQTTFLNFTYSINDLVRNKVQLDVTNATTGFLPNTLKVYPQAASIITSLIQFTSDIDNTIDGSNQLQHILETIVDSTSKNSQDRLISQLKKFMESLETTVEKNSQQLIHLLRTQLNPTSPIWNTYMNSKHTTCDLMRAPLNGMWAAAGLASLFFMPAALILFVVSKWFFADTRSTKVFATPTHVTHNVATSWRKDSERTEQAEDNCAPDSNTTPSPVLQTEQQIETMLYPTLREENVGDHDRGDVRL